jgi:hypothetical protein
MLAAVGTLVAGDGTALGPTAPSLALVCAAGAAAYVGVLGLLVPRPSWV